MSLRVLFFAYYFPPSGGPGVRRSIRFVKRLEGHGIEPVVVTVTGKTFENPEEFGLDPAGLEEIPEGIRVERVPAWSLSRMRAFLMRLKLMRPLLMAVYPAFWERQALWVVPAIHRGLKLARELRPDVIYTSTGPFCTNLVGLALSRATGIPWVTDYRDLWTGSCVRWWPSRAHLEMERALERVVLKEAAHVVANTPTAREELLRFPALTPDRVTTITNAWDDVPLPAPRPTGSGDGPLVLLHTGSFDARAGDEKVRTGFRAWIHRHFEFRLEEYDRSTHGPGYLFRALVELRRDRPELAAKLRFRLVGRVHESWEVEAKRLGIEDLVEFLGARPFLESRRLQREADVLVLTTVSRRDGGPVPRVNAKLYEYMASQRPILVLSDPGDAHEFAERTGLGWVVPPRDVGAIRQALEKLASSPRTLGETYVPRREEIDAFSATRVTEQLADVLRLAAARNARARPETSSKDGSWS
jgi:glycosyltransferase involved in cell wall biosynthesis